MEHGEWQGEAEAYFHIELWGLKFLTCKTWDNRHITWLGSLYMVQGDLKFSAENLWRILFKSQLLMSYIFYCPLFIPSLSPFITHTTVFLQISLVQNLWPRTFSKAIVGHSSQACWRIKAVPAAVGSGLGRQFVCLVWSVVFQVPIDVSFSHLHSEGRANALWLTEENMGYRVCTDFQTLILLISLH